MAASTDQAFYSCPICGQTSPTAPGIGAHRATHSIAERKRALREKLQEVAGNKETVTQEEFFEKTQYGNYSVTSVYESWEQGLLAAGLVPSRRFNISSDEILEDMRRVAEDFGGRISATTYDKHGIVGHGTIDRRFGSWQQAARKAGVSCEHKNLSNSELLKDFRQVVDGCEVKLTGAEFDRRSEHSYETYLERFGTWESVFEEVGVDPDEYLGPRSHGDKRERYGPRWRMHRQQVCDRDDDMCRVCGEPDTQTTLHVHHIRPARLFSVYREMNDHSNLITLCPSCHQTFEGNWQSVSPATFARLAQATRPDKSPLPLPASETANPPDLSVPQSRSTQTTIESWAVTDD